MFGINQSMARRVQEQNHKNQQEKQMLDGIKEAAEQIGISPTDERMAITAIATMRLSALSIVIQTALVLDEGQDEDNEMLPNELLDGFMLEAIDEDSDDEDEDINPVLRSTISACVADAFNYFGVDESIIDDLFSSDFDVADTAIESACATVVENLPEDGKPLDDFITAFAYGYDMPEATEEEGFDGIGSFIKNIFAGKSSTKKVKGKSLRYKAEKVIKNGHVAIMNKRISGKYRMSAKQKAAFRKMQHKAQTGSAIRKRIRSFLKGARMGLHD